MTRIKSISIVLAFMVAGYGEARAQEVDGLCYATVERAADFMEAAGGPLNDRDQFVDFMAARASRDIPTSCSMILRLPDSSMRAMARAILAGEPGHGELFAACLAFPDARTGFAGSLKLGRVVHKAAMRADGAGRPADHADQHAYPLAKTMRGSPLPEFMSRLGP